MNAAVSRESRSRTASAIVKIDSIGVQIGCQMARREKFWGYHSPNQLKWSAMHPASPISLEYCRKARRVRAVYGTNLAQMHVRLRRLAENAPTDRAVDRPKRRTESDELGFAQLAARRVQESGMGVLCYGDRADLLIQASRRGVGRFEANLMIALAQHRMRVPTSNLCPTRRFDWRPIALFLIVQSLIACGIWAMIAA
jgi:hypothetical protein